jgi:hypothetical protein
MILLNSDSAWVTYTTFFGIYYLTDSSHCYLSFGDEQPTCQELCYGRGKRLPTLTHREGKRKMLKCNL